MNEIEAKIFDIEGDIFFEVNLLSLPRIGELISFYSFADAREQKRNPRRHYEVVQVVHHVADRPKSVPHAVNHRHNAAIYVKPIESKYLTE